MALWEVYQHENHNYDKYREKLEEPFKNLYPLRACVVGDTSSGKTTIVKNLVFKHYEPVLKYVFLFSGTNTTIEEFEELHKKVKPSFKLKTFSDYDDELVNTICDKLKEKRLPSLFVFDDLGFRNVMKKHTSNAIDRLYQTGRHYNISTIFIAQRYTQLNTSCRQNNSNLMIIFNANDKELDNLYKEQGGILTKSEFNSIFKKATGEPYGFLVIDYTEHDKHKRFKDKNFQPLVESKDNADNFSLSSDEDEPEEEHAEPKPRPKITKRRLPKDLKMVQFKKANDGKNMMVAVFKKAGADKEVAFGQKDMTKEQFMEKYGDEDFSNPTKRRSLERWILYHTSDIKKNIKLFKKVFKL